MIMLLMMVMMMTMMLLLNIGRNSHSVTEKQEAPLTAAFASTSVVPAYITCGSSGSPPWLAGEVGEYMSYPWHQERNQQVLVAVRDHHLG